MKQKMISFRVDPLLDERVQQEAKEHKISTSEMWRRIGYYYFSSMIKKLFK